MAYHMYVCQRKWTYSLRKQCKALFEYCVYVSLKVIRQRRKSEEAIIYTARHDNDIRQIYRLPYANSIEIRMSFRLLLLFLDEFPFLSVPTIGVFSSVCSYYVWLHVWVCVFVEHSNSHTTHNSNFLTMTIYGLLLPKYILLISCCTTLIQTTSLFPTSGFLWLYSF